MLRKIILRKSKQFKIKRYIDLVFERLDFEEDKKRYIFLLILYLLLLLKKKIILCILPTSAQQQLFSNSCLSIFTLTMT